MSINIYQHPILTAHQEINSICKPLTKLHINYFAHVQIDSQDKFSAITNNAYFSEHYLLNKYYNVDIHMLKPNIFNELVIWDAIERKGLSKKMHEEARAFGVTHTFTLIERGISTTDYYHFAGNEIGKSINQVYLTHIDKLKAFIFYFKEKISQSKFLSGAYDIKFPLDPSAEGYSMTDLHTSIQRDDNHFIEQIKTGKYIYFSSSKKALSLREFEILAWLHYGKTIFQIATILNIKPVTVNKHLANIKLKTQCYTQFQLGEFFNKFFSFYK